MKHLLLILVLTLVWVGCRTIAFGPGLQDFSASLPHGYFIHRTSAHQIIIAPQSWSDDMPIIPPKVVKLDHDEHFLIAKQQLLERRSPNNPNDTYEQPKPNAFQYWILELQNPQVFGPFTLEEFQSERKRLGVTTSLKLHDVYDYRP